MTLVDLFKARLAEAGVPAQLITTARDVAVRSGVDMNVVDRAITAAEDGATALQKLLDVARQLKELRR